jgi:hypothetical protein
MSRAPLTAAQHVTVRTSHAADGQQLVEKCTRDQLRIGARDANAHVSAVRMADTAASRELRS